MTSIQINELRETRLGQVFIRERFTNILVRMTKRISEVSSFLTDPEYNSLRNEALEILAEYPDWKDVANSWLPIGHKF